MAIRYFDKQLPVTETWYLNAGDVIQYANFPGVQGVVVCREPPFIRTWWTHGKTFDYSEKLPQGIVLIGRVDHDDVAELARTAVAAAIAAMFNMNPQGQPAREASPERTRSIDLHDRSNDK